jgi:D-amino-acid dehydrogenase
MNAMQRTVIVLGAGMVGTCTAVHLALRGHDVTLVDRRQPGQETSYGNAGIIQREAVEPYAFPQDWATLAQVALKRGAAVNYHLAALPVQARALAGYWAHSRPERHAQVSAAYARLIEHAQTEHQALIELSGAADLVRRDGYLCLFREEKTMHEAAARAERLVQRYGPGGLRHAVLDTAALAQAEPALQERLPGALHWQDPWSVSDPGELVGGRYAALLARYGGRFVQGDAATLQATATGWRVRTAAGDIDAEHAVVALGPWSDTLLKPLGYHYPLFVKRGYHCHYRGAEGPRLPTLDADGGLVLAPMQRGLRLTTGAEFALVDAPPTPVQLKRAEVLARQLYAFGEPVESEPWVGARPCTADMLPVIGPAPRHRGLWFNFGHAHQGFTLGPVSGRLMAELIEGGGTVVDAGVYGAGRFG